MRDVGAGTCGECEYVADLRAVRGSRQSDGVQLYGDGTDDSVCAVVAGIECVVAQILAGSCVFAIGDGGGVFDGVGGGAVSVDEFYGADYGAFGHALLFCVGAK